jgi:hypothetical protein
MRAKMMVSSWRIREERMEERERTSRVVMFSSCVVEERAVDQRGLCGADICWSGFWKASHLTRDRSEMRTSLLVIMVLLCSL